MARSTARSARLLRTDGTAEQQERAVLDAAAHEFADVGVRRANMDVVARRAGVSRSTLYRRFANKEQLLAAVLRDESTAIGQQILQRVQGCTPTEAIVEALRVGVQQMDTNPLLRRILVTDPGLAGGIFGFTEPEMDSVLATVSTGVARTLRSVGARMPEKDLRVASEVMVRISTSLLQGSSRIIDLGNDDAVQEFAEKFLAKLVW